MKQLPQGSTQLTPLPRNSTYLDKGHSIHIKAATGKPTRLRGSRWLKHSAAPVGAGTAAHAEALVACSCMDRCAPRTRTAPEAGQPHLCSMPAVRTPRKQHKSEERLIQPPPPTPRCMLYFWRCADPRSKSTRPKVLEPHNAMNYSSDSNSTHLTCTPNTLQNAVTCCATGADSKPLAQQDPQPKTLAKQEPQPKPLENWQLPSITMPQTHWTPAPRVTTSNSTEPLWHDLLELTAQPGGQQQICVPGLCAPAVSWARCHHCV